MGIKVIVSPGAISLEFGVQSVAELHELLKKEETALGELFADFGGGIGEVASDEPKAAGDSAAPATTTTNKDGSPRKRRGSAVAPPPLAVSGAAPPPAPPTPPVASAPVDQTLNADGTPRFLDRTLPPMAPATNAAPPPAPPAPPAPPVVPAAPAIAPSAEKVMAELKRRNGLSTDGGKSLVVWLSQNGVCSATAAFDEAVNVLQFTKEERLVPLATALGV